jgi:hypothetical protein
MVMGSIRNPWDWYVSLWAYGSNEKGGLFDRLTKKSTSLGVKKMGLGHFRDGLHEIRKPTSLWQDAYGDPMNPSLFRKWLRLVMDPSRYRDLGERFSESSISGFAGFMTYRYCKLYLRNFFEPDVFDRIGTLDDLIHYDNDNCLIDLLVRQESLEDDLIEALKESGHTLTEEMVSIIRSGKENKVNRSERESGAGFYYDAETIQLVRDAERFIIDKYDYSPPMSE